MTSVLRDGVSPYTKGDIVVFGKEVFTITSIEDDYFVTLTSCQDSGDCY